MSTSGTIVYVITNTINGKRYIGITKQGIGQRWSRHVHAAKSGRPTRIAAAIRKYGRECFTIVCVAEYDTRQAALEAEVRLITEIAPEYNVTSGGDGVSMPRSAATRAKLSASRRGKPGTFLGKKHSPEAVEKMRAAATGRVGHWRGKQRPDVGAINRARLLKNPVRYWLGKTRSEETKAKIRLTKSGRPPPKPTDKATASRSNNIRMAIAKIRMPVECVEDAKTFESMTSAATYYGCNKTSISQVVAGKRNSLFGKTFRACG